MTTPNLTDETYTKFDVADITFDQLKEMVENYYVGPLSRKHWPTLALTEAVRRFVSEDRSPPGGQDQTRQFEMSNLILAWGIGDMTFEQLGGIIGSLTRSGDITDRIDDIELIAGDYGFFLTEQGVDEGLSLIRNFRRFFDQDHELSQFDVISHEVIDSTDWTGLGKAISREHSLIIRSKANSLLQAIIQSDADISSRTDACKRVEAAITLLEAPNVPWREVVNLLAHPSVSAFLAALNLIQFILGFGK